MIKEVISLEPKLTDRPEVRASCKELNINPLKLDQLITFYAFKNDLVSQGYKVRRRNNPDGSIEITATKPKKLYGRLSKR